MRAAVLQKMLQFREGRDLRRAEQARHREGAARIGIGAAGLQRLALQPAAQEPGQERVARAEHVIDLDRKAGTLDALIERVGNFAGKDDAAHRPALADDRRMRSGADGADRRERVLEAAGDMQFLFRADDQVAIGEDRLQMFRHLIGAHIALFAGLMAEQAPKGSAGNRRRTPPCGHAPWRCGSPSSAPPPCWPARNACRSPRPRRPTPRSFSSMSSSSSAMSAQFSR